MMTSIYASVQERVFENIVFDFVIETANFRRFQIIFALIPLLEFEPAK